MEISEGNSISDLVLMFTSSCLLLRMYRVNDVIGGMGGSKGKFVVGNRRF